MVMDNMRSKLTALGVAPSIDELRNRTCTLIVPAIDGEDEALTTQAWRIQLPDEAYPALIAGRMALQRLSTGWWSVTGQWEGDAFRADEIREGTESLNRPERTLWTRGAGREEQQGAGVAGSAPARTLVLEGEGPTLAQAQGKGFYLTLSATDEHIDPYADPADWPVDPEPPWVRDPEWIGPGPSGSARFKIALPDEVHAAVDEHIQESGAAYQDHNRWSVTAELTAEPYVLAGEEISHYPEFGRAPAFVWQSERVQAQAAEVDAIAAESERAALVEGMRVLGLDPDNPEAVAAYQDWLECDPAPHNPPGRAQSLAYDRMMAFAAPAAEQQLVEEEWGDWFASQQGGRGAEQQRQHATELE